MNVIELTPGQSAFLGPVAKWRVIDLQSIVKECVLGTNYFWLARTIRQLESKGVVKSYRRPKGGKKYVYLTRLGEELVGHEENPAGINQDTLLHDLLVSELVREFARLGWIDSWQLEHEIHNKRTFGAAERLVPDASVQGRKGDKSFRIAIELELTIKSHARLEDKLRHYLGQKHYDYFLYVFPKANQRDNFLELIKSKFGDQAQTRLMCFCWDQANELPEAIGSFKGQKLTLKEIFS